MRSQNRLRAFTLIELMVVVAIFSIGAAFLLPLFLTARHKGQARAAAPQAVPTPAGPRGAAPDIRALTLTLQLRETPVREGMDVVGRYELAYEGRMTVLSGGATRLTTLEIPFPQASQARDISVLLEIDGKIWEPADTVLSPTGVTWTGEIPDGHELRALVRYVACGSDRLELALPPAVRMGSVRVTLQGAAHPKVAVNSLPVTAVEHDQLSWSYQNLASSQSLVVNLPAAESQTGKVLLLCRLVGFAVALFGLGFWYLGELYSPGRLTRVRGGQFFLLALTYSFFFPVLAVLTLSNEVALGWAMGWAALLSLPLLMLHVSRVVDAWFAFVYTLPLAILTLALVVNGVFGGVYRDFAYLGAAFVTVSFLTISYRRWHRNRCQAQLNLEQELEQKVARLAELAREGREDSRELQDAMIHCTDAVREPLVVRRKTLLDQVQEAEALVQEFAELASQDCFAKRCEQRIWLAARCEQVKTQLPVQRRSARLALHHGLEAQARVVLRQHKAEPGSVAYCVQCGHGSAPSPCCPSCGQRRPRRYDCACGCSLILASEGVLGSHCPGCGEPTVQLQG